MASLPPRSESSQLLEDVDSRPPFVAFHRVHQVDHPLVEGGFDAVFSATLDDAAVDDVDLGLSSSFKVLEHRSLRGSCVAHRHFEGFVGPLAVFGTADD